MSPESVAPQHFLKKHFSHIKPCRVFITQLNMAVHGMGAAKIMKALIREKVPTPGWLQYTKTGAYAHIYQNAPEKARYAWNETKVRHILTDENYLGNSIHNKTSVKSFKLKKQTRNPVSEWVRVEGTHEAIVSKDVFDQV